MDEISVHTAAVVGFHVRPVDEKCVAPRGGRQMLRDILAGVLLDIQCFLPMFGSFPYCVHYSRSRAVKPCRNETDCTGADGSSGMFSPPERQSAKIIHFFSIFSPFCAVFILFYSEKNAGEARYTQFLSVLGRLEASGTLPGAYRRRLPGGEDSSREIADMYAIDKYLNTHFREALTEETLVREFHIGKRQLNGMIAAKAKKEP